MQANSYPKNLEGFIMLEKLKEQEEMEKKEEKGFVHYTQMPLYSKIMN